MKKLFPEIKRALFIFLIWRISLEIFLRIAAHYIPVDPTFPYYAEELKPFYTREAAVWAHFDGVHYLRMATTGYRDQGYPAFFPLYPTLIKGLTFFTNNPLFSATLISNFCLFLSILLLGRLLNKKDFSKTILLILLFPTSFYFAAAYTESLFFLLIVSFFYLLKKNNWFLAAIIAGLASGTRIIGAALSLSLIIPLIQQSKKSLKKNLSRIISLTFISLSGLIAYMGFLHQKYRDPLAFLHVQPLFGAERSGNELILLPQVLYRYSKMLITVDPSLYLYKRVLLELIISLFFLYLIIRSRKILSLPEFTFALIAVLLPTLTGTFSSMPRYVLLIYPLFLVWGRITPKNFYLPTLIFLGILQGIFFTIFLKGWFVA